MLHMLHVLPVRQHPHIRHYSKHPIMCIKGGLVDERETEMMSVRWNQFTFTSQIAASEEECVPPCGHCFSVLYN